MTKASAETAAHCPKKNKPPCGRGRQNGVDKIIMAKNIEEVKPNLTLTLYQKPHSRGEAENPGGYIKTFEVKPGDTATLASAVLYDNCPAQYRDGYRNGEKFERADCILADTDNSHSEDPATWITHEDVTRKLKNVAFYFYPSRNHMKPKDGKAPRPKTHYIFPVDTLTDANDYAALMERLITLFPELHFDTKVKSPAQLNFGVENPQVSYVPGIINLSDFLRSMHSRLADDELKADIAEEPTQKVNPLRVLAGVHQGERDDMLFRYACRLRTQGMSKEEASLLVLAAAKNCRPPFQEAAALQKVESAWRYETHGNKQQEADTQEATPWPGPLAEEAYHGLTGELVRLIDPHTEADPAAVLFNFLALYGNVIGRQAHFRVEADKHYTNLFVCLVGLTSKGRKGTSYGRAKSLFEGIDLTWTARQTGGLSSGEGLIWACRDEIKQKNKKGVEELIDSGVSDKRLLVAETEFASVIRVFGREGNRLSPIIRQAWDTGDLNTLTKNSPARATGAHISILAHITKDELVRYLDNTEAGNGFGNRFLWVCVKRSKTLPEGGQLHTEDFTNLFRKLSEAVEWGKCVGVLSRDNEARELWAAIYPGLSEGKMGLLGAMLARAEAQVLRLACIYALLDLSAMVKVVHLRAALACWDYCEQSARFIFGKSLGDPVADEILRVIRHGGAEGLTRTDISNHFGRNKSAETIGRALSLLAERGLITCVKFPSGGGGRPAERWISK
ncbi:MAG: hypothetical protein DDT19_01920 [Syntrophomonadaceae bacterium]|nr:hypothetical protein [Bacillota bacterium]